MNELKIMIITFCIALAFVSGISGNRNEVTDASRVSVERMEKETSWHSANQSQQGLRGSSLPSKSYASLRELKPATANDNLLKPTSKMIDLITHLLVGQASAGKKHRSILLKGMHSLVDSSVEEQDLLKLEHNFKQAHGEIKHLEDGTHRSYFSNGPFTPKVPFSMFSEHRERFVAELKKEIGTNGSAEKYDFVIFEGGDLRNFYDTDMELEFRQEANFFWLFGVREPNVKAAIDLRSGETHLFVRKHGHNFQILSGMDATGEDAFKWWKEKYEVEHVSYESDMERVLIEAIQKDNAGGEKLEVVVSVLLADKPRDQHVDNHIDAFSPKQLTILSDPGSIVSKALRDLRLIKDRWEIQIMQYVSDVSAEAHVMAMQQSAVAAQRQGVISMEWAAESVFRYTSAMRGCLDVAYEASCPGGSNTAFFHYGADSWEPNSEMVGPGDIRMLDMAAAYFGYTGDVTISYPENGHFSVKQKLLYNAVLEAQVETEKIVKPGVTFTQLQEKSERVLLAHLKNMGILVGDLEEMQRNRIVSKFMPHGVGHSLGIDCHDDPLTSQSWSEPFRANWVITVEPALYFNPLKLEELAASDTLNRYVNLKVLDEWKNIGGMRLEDDLLVTETGCKVLTRVPRKTEDIEAVMSGRMPWKPWEKTIIVYDGV